MNNYLETKFPIALKKWCNKNNIVFILCPSGSIGFCLSFKHKQRNVHMVWATPNWSTENVVDIQFQNKNSDCIGDGDTFKFIPTHNINKDIQSYINCLSDCLFVAGYKTFPKIY